jgi:hypothetical protein
VSPTFSSPNHGGVRPQTLGIVIHSTRGGSANAQTEFDSTVTWFNSLASQVSAHAVVGPNGQIAWPVDPANIAWHARSWNDTHLGIELAQPHLGTALDPTIVDAAAKIVAEWVKTYDIPVVWDVNKGLAEHWEIPPGVAEGKTDIQGPFDRADFLARVRRYALGSPANLLTTDQKTAVLDDLDFLWAYSTASEFDKNPAESEKILHERIAALKTTLGLQ